MNITSGICSTEGDELYYKVRGEGKPILFIAPGGGNGDDYLNVANSLAKTYKVITYDRRANARSTRNFPEEFSIRQQSRDALAVLKQAGETKALIAGNSSGAVIALDMAFAYPEHVHAAIIHEAPMYSLLPDAEKWKDFFDSCKDLARSKGAAAGATKFYFNVELPSYALIWATIKSRLIYKQEILGDEPPRINRAAASEVLLFNELLPVTGYTIDEKLAKKSGVPLFFGCSAYGVKRNAWYISAAHLLADKLSGEIVNFPGHHGSFMDQPDKWAKVILEIAAKIE